MLGGPVRQPSDDSEAGRLKSRHPLQRVCHVPERDLARDEPRRVQLSARDERQKLIVVGVRIAFDPTTSHSPVTRLSIGMATRPRSSCEVSPTWT